MRQHPSKLQTARSICFGSSCCQFFARRLCEKLALRTVELHYINCSRMGEFVNFGGGTNRPFLHVVVRLNAATSIFLAEHDNYGY